MGEVRRYEREWRKRGGEGEGGGIGGGGGREGEKVRVLEEKLRGLERKFAGVAEERDKLLMGREEGERARRAVGSMVKANKSLQQEVEEVMRQWEEERGRGERARKRVEELEYELEMERGGRGRGGGEEEGESGGEGDHTLLNEILLSPDMKKGEEGREERGEGKGEKKGRRVLFGSDEKEEEEAGESLGGFEEMGEEEEGDGKEEEIFEEDSLSSSLPPHNPTEEEINQALEKEAPPPTTFVEQLQHLLSSQPLQLPSSSSSPWSSLQLHDFDDDLNALHECSPLSPSSSSSLLEEEIQGWLEGEGGEERGEELLRRLLEKYEKEKRDKLRLHRLAYRLSYQLQSTKVEERFFLEKLMNSRVLLDASQVFIFVYFGLSSISFINY